MKGVNSFKNNQEGQALLIVVLVMIIALTVGLALISRSITSVKTSTDQADSQKALAAAEAGIEQSIKSNSPIGEGQGSFGTDTQYSTSIAAVSGTTFLLNGGDLIQRDDSADLWMSDYSTDSAKLYAHPTSANLSIDFNTSKDNCSNPAINPAIEVDVVSGSKAAPILTKYAYDPCSSRRSSNHFSAPDIGDTINGVVFTNKTHLITISPESPGLFVRIIPIYSSTIIGVTSDTSLPSQGSIITATGCVSPNNNGCTGSNTGTQRSVTVFQGFPKIPAEVFPYTFFAPSN